MLFDNVTSRENNHKLKSKKLESIEMEFYFAWMRERSFLSIDSYHIHEIGHSYNNINKKKQTFLEHESLALVFLYFFKCQFFSSFFRKRTNWK